MDGYGGGNEFFLMVGRREKSHGQNKRKKEWICDFSKSTKQQTSLLNNGLVSS